MVNPTYARTPVKTIRIYQEFTGNKLTNYAGLVPFAEFLLGKLPFRQALAEELNPRMTPNCRYGNGQVFGLIVFGYLRGYRRFSHFCRA